MTKVYITKYDVLYFDKNYLPELPSEDVVEVTLEDIKEKEGYHKVLKWSFSEKKAYYVYEQDDKVITDILSDKVSELEDIIMILTM